MATQTTPNSEAQAVTSDDDVKRRLFEAAGEVFAEQGFQSATVREICKRAGANVAAINYHFGGKDRLYSEALRYWAGVSMAKYPPNMGITADASPEIKLDAFVRSFLLRILEGGRSTLYGRLIARELIEPTHALDERIAETIGPMLKILESIVREILGRDATPEDVRRGVGSVIGQTVLYKHCRAVLDKVYPDMKFDTAEINRIADHVTQFSLAGLRMMAERVRNAPSSTDAK